MVDLVDVHDEEGLEENARYIFDQVLASTQNRSVDSQLPPFFITDEISDECQRFATAMTCICYTPKFTDPNETYSIKASHIMYFSVLAGFQAYIKERGLNQIVNEFTYPTDRIFIQEKWDYVFEKLVKNDLDASNVSMVAAGYFYDEVLKNIDWDELKIKGHRLKKKRNMINF